MKFTLTVDNFNEGLVHRKINETGKYEIFLKPVIFGWRVGFGEVGSGMYLFDYCAGDDIDRIGELYGKVESILSKDLPLKDILGLLPEQNVKPYYNDPNCLIKLDILAGEYEKEDLPDLDQLRKVIYSKLL